MTLPAGATADARKAAILAVITASGLHPLHAARSVGVSASAWYRLVEGDQEFRDQIESATDVYARRMAVVIARAASTLGSWKAAAWWLERRLPDLYGARLDLRMSDAPPERVVEEGLSKDARAARLAALVAEATARLP